MEPYLRMNEMVSSSGSNNTLTKLARYLLYRVSRKMELWYQSESIRRVGLSADGSVAFTYRSGSAKSHSTGWRRFTVSLGGHRIKISDDDVVEGGDNLIESYTIGMDPIPVRHLSRYHYLRESISQIRCIVPRALVAYADNGLTGLLGSSRFPGLYFELLMLPADILSMERSSTLREGTDWQSRERPLDSIFLDHSNCRSALIQLWSVRLESREGQYSNNTDSDPSSSLPSSATDDWGQSPIVYSALNQTPITYHQKRNPSSRRSMSSSGLCDSLFSISSPSPLYSGASALYRRWVQSAIRLNSNSLHTSLDTRPHLTTPITSASRPSGEHYRTDDPFIELAEFMRNYSLVDDLKACDMVLLIKKTECKESDIQPLCDGAIELRVNLLEVLRWNGKEKMNVNDSLSSSGFKKSRELNLPRHLLSKGYLDTSDESIMAMKSDGRGISWSVDSACNLLASNLEILKTVSIKDADNIKTYHRIIADQAAEGPIDVLKTHEIYRSLFPTISILDQ
eukprot:GHVH01017195.1.p1 GENE.GHVH01017195.1~~GHVH01017195.1.p1  ORF type:complete len:511 (-),score=59.87 GHVH01017195.1:1106-2638(-)